MKSRIRNMTRCGFAAAVLAALTACGGGDSGPAPPPPPAMYTVGGTVTGLTGSGLLLASGFGNLPVSAAGTFTFGTRVVSGTPYSVSVEAQPSSPTQYCSVANASGIVAAANVTNVSVTCGNGYTVGGTVSGLVGSGLVLQISAPGYGGYPYNVSPPLPINSNGPFTFDFVSPGNTSGTFVRIGHGHQPAR